MTKFISRSLLILTVSLSSSLFSSEKKKEPALIVDNCNAGGQMAIAMEAFKIKPENTYIISLVSEGFQSRERLIKKTRALNIPDKNVSSIYRHGLGKKVHVEGDDGIIALKLQILSLTHEKVILITVDQDENRMPGEPETIIGSVEQVLEANQTHLTVAYKSKSHKIFGKNWWKLKRKYKHLELHKLTPDQDLKSRPLLLPQMEQKIDYLNSVNLDLLTPLKRRKSLRRQPKRELSPAF